MSNFFKVIYSY